MSDKLNDCGCCAGLSAQTPSKIENLPGLSAVAYRVGTQAQFKQSMLTDLSKTDRSALRDLTTREDDDFSIALLDAAATMADALTFYQERIANESYLRTASERRSLLELARLIGYEPSPGAAANAWLAFTLEDTPGAPEEITIDAGVKVQSVPGPGEQSQTFETVEAIKARSAWNALKPALTEPQDLQAGKTEVYLEGVTTGLKPGDVLLFMCSEGWHFCRLRTVSVNSVMGTTRVTLDQGWKWRTTDKSELPPKGTEVYALRQRAALFGHNAPDRRTLPDGMRTGYSPQRGLYAEYFAGTNLTDRRVARVDPQVKFNWGQGSPDPSISSDEFSVRWTGWIKTKSSGSYTFYIKSDDGARLWVNDQNVFYDWKIHAAPTQPLASNPICLDGERLYPICLEYYEQTGLAEIELSWKGPGWNTQPIPAENLCTVPDEWPDLTITTISGDNNKVCLDAMYSQILPESWLVLFTPERQELYRVTKAVEDARTKFTLNAKLTCLSLIGDLTAFNNKVRQTVVFAQSELLKLAEEVPITESECVQGKSITLDQVVKGLVKDQTLIVCGRGSSDQPQVERVQLQATDLDNNRTRLTLSSELKSQYKPATVTINANVAKATHGETKEEILGSGDASLPYQRFALRQRPLTYVTTSAANGADSTLKVYANDVLWHETPTLYGRESRMRVYVTQRDDNGQTVIQFGDGRTGGRLPTGQENIRAVYRSGIGLAGNVKANQLTLPMSRPLGVRSVTNPLPATDGADPEAMDDIRRNAPLKVLTLERAVSLRDYEDFARAFTGIAKAYAVWIWDGRQRCVFLTVAGPAGNLVSTDRINELLSALHKASDPYASVKVQNYRKVLFKLAAKVKVDPDYLPEKVLPEVRKALCIAFSFDARAFGQSVTLSEIAAIVHKVPGVLAVDINKPQPDTLAPVQEPKTAPTNWKMAKSVFAAMQPLTGFYHSLMPKEPQLVKWLAPMTSGKSTSEILVAELPETGSESDVQAAELLMINVDSLELTEM